MRRRALITLLGGAALWPRAARAQASARMRRVAVLQPQSESDREAQSWVGAFRQQLERLGWTDARNIRLDLRWYAGDLDRLRGQATELVGLQPDVVFCMSTPTVAALQKATRTIPIVFVNANDPLGSGFVASLARPGGNITGFVAFEPSIGEKWLELLREVAPGVARVGLIYNPKTHTGQHFQTLEAAARSLSLTLVRLSFGEAAEIERGLDGFARQPNGGVIVLPDSSARVHRDLIVKLAARHRLPAVYSYRVFIDSGGLAYYGTNTTAQFSKAAEYVDRILRGDRPADMPVQQPTTFELVVNLKTAKALGLDVPPSIMLRADEVIE